jgi:hypothetical protein
MKTPEESQGENLTGSTHGLAMLTVIMIYVFTSEHMTTGDVQ